MDMGQKIKKLREEQGMTLEELGSKVGVGKSTIRKWETGIIANMKRDKIAKVAHALNVEPAYLMGWDAQETPAPEPNTLAAHFEGEEFTEAELEEISNFIKFVKAKRDN